VTDSTTKRSMLHRLGSRAAGHRLLTTFALLGMLSAGILIGSTFTGTVSGKEQVNSSDARPITIPSPVTLSNGFSQIVKQVGPAVVNISTVSLPKPATPANRRRQRNPNGDPDQGDPNGAQGGDQGDMQDFFNRFFGGQNPNGGDDSSRGEQRALGSGYIVDSRGYIITNNHVVDKADRIYVRLSTDPDANSSTDPGRPAKVVGVDKDTDIAVIKIETKEPLPTIKLGNSDGAQVGDWVLAIGSPFGLSQTVSAGIVSAKNRTIEDESSTSRIATNQFQRFIQTDAAINPGNSGGPLVDMAGQVIGMNTAIYTQSMGSEGVGFAMPSNVVASVYNMLIGPEHKVTRGSIGIQFQSRQSASVGRIYGFQSGVIISAVTPHAPAEKAGLQPGDVIYSIDGRNIKDGDDLVQDISARKIGSTAKIGYLRDGKKMTAEVGIADRTKTVSEVAGDTSPDNDSGPSAPDVGQNKLGITVAPVPPSMQTKLGIHGGVAVGSVRPGSFGEDVGLGRGLIILQINKKPIDSEATYRSIVGELKSGDDVVFVVHDAEKGGGDSFLGGTLP
jgi:serine protease Do